MGDPPTSSMRGCDGPRIRGRSPTGQDELTLGRWEALLVWPVITWPFLEREPRSRPMDVTYRLEPELGAEEFIDLLVRSTLAERRPVDDPQTIRGMLRHADLILTARSDGRLVGVSRAITDFSYCTYLSDL